LNLELKGLVSFLNTLSALLWLPSRGLPVLLAIPQVNTNDIDPDKALAVSRSPSIRGQFIANVASGMTGGDLKGKTFCWGPNSTSGYGCRALSKANGIRMPTSLQL
jgi:hypothetical protein